MPQTVPDETVTPLDPSPTTSMKKSSKAPKGVAVADHEVHAMFAGSALVTPDAVPVAALRGGVPASCCPLKNTLATAEAVLVTVIVIALFDID